MIYPVYKFARNKWHQREYLFYASTDSRAIDFAGAWRRANPWSNGCFLAASRDELPTGAKLNTYRGWQIDFEYGYYTAIHDNYDASWEGEEDGWVDNGLRISERSLECLINEIDLHETSSPTSWSTPICEDAHEV